MARRKIIQIDEEKCDGCGQCVTSCAEGALKIIDGKARLVSETYCDGLGACLGECPQKAIRIEEREAADFDEAQVKKHLAASSGACPGHAHGQHGHGHSHSQSGGCPGSMARSLAPKAAANSAAEELPSALRNWPVQLMLANPAAPYFQGADLLIAADCTPFAYADFHRRFLNKRALLIGCPKLDDGEFYVRKLVQLIQSAQPRSITVVRMEVPCCAGLSYIVQQALANSGAAVAFTEVIIGIQGDVLAEAPLA